MKPMINQQIEKVKQEYTDKYVVVDAGRPELARFSELVGQVKTVNMSGRALVEFGDYHKNIAWYDIDLDYLKVVDKPAPKDDKKTAAKKKPAAKPAAKQAEAATEKKLSPLEMARMQDSGGKAKAKAEPKAKPSTADILAAARGDAPAAASKPKADRAKMSVADMIAAARAETSAPAKEEVAAPVEPEPVAEAAAAPAAEAAPAKVDRSSMSVDEMVAYCREKDAQ